MIKYFRFSIDQILWDISYQNILMLMATIPSSTLDDKKEEKPKEITEASEFADFFGVDL